MPGVGACADGTKSIDYRKAECGNEICVAGSAYCDLLKFRTALGCPPVPGPVARDWTRRTPPQSLRLRESPERR